MAAEAVAQEAATEEMNRKVEEDMKQKAEGDSTAAANSAGDISEENSFVKSTPVSAAAAVAANDLDLLAQGRHPNPAAVLGRKLVDGEVILRVWVTGASEIKCIVRMDGKQGKAKLHRAEGASGPSWLFQGCLKADGLEDFSKWEFELAVEWAAGGTCQQKDPYSFGAILPSETLQKWASGTPVEPVAATFGAHHIELKPGVWGTRFAVWAPAAEAVCLVGDFNFWDGAAHPMCSRSEFGVWELFLPVFSFEGHRGQKYGYKVLPKGGEPSIRIDPFALEFVHPAGGAHDAKVPWCDDYSRANWNGAFGWSDGAWLEKRKKLSSEWEKQPLAIYEVHLPSWAAQLESVENGSRQGYRELAEPLAAHCKALGFNCIEFLPLSQYPCDGSWGYQCAGGMFAADARLGTPDDLKFLVNTLHEHSIAVFVDFVGAHFAKDDWGITNYCGSPQFEYEGALGEIPGWGTARYNYSKPEVKAFLLGAARHWIEHFHVDGLRLDAVAAMVYSNFGREEDGDAIIQGRGVVNEDGVKFLRELCQYVKEQHPGVLLSAEDSTNFKWVTDRPAAAGTERSRHSVPDLGFHLKWNMGFTYDTLAVCKSHQDGRAHMQIFGWKQLSWFLQYAYNERWVLPLSHDNAQPKSLLQQMEATSEAQRYALLQVLWAYSVGMPGRPLLFMGSEIGEEAWSFDKPIDWKAAKEDESKSRLMSWVASVLKLYQAQPALHAEDDIQESFSWCDMDSSNKCVFSWRRSAKGARDVVVVANFSTNSIDKYTAPIPKALCGLWECAACSMALASGSDLPSAPVAPESGKLEIKKLDGLAAQIWLAPVPVRITFELRHPSIKEEESDALSMRAVGGCDLLGNWNSEVGLVLEKTTGAEPSTTTWKAEVVVPPSLGKLEFKFISIASDGAVCWESFDGNRVLQELWTTDKIHIAAEFGNRNHSLS
eukprot:CAMPEP_0178406164 /NCGR_PEP_ID=MMETSP0689_2-20121128/18771_1 /TAXON_ID=160604 /ORGANISM="Amphidinium massartii, Strain CS-259" /LENGTH=938 /DNA_ID=CAMNT_0020027197 /DNA_START=73 /DNA_END=2889 /DNA_ORIENTATION=-